MSSTIITNPSTEFPNIFGQISLVRLQEPQPLEMMNCPHSTFYSPCPEIWIVEKGLWEPLHAAYTDTTRPYLVVRPIDPSEDINRLVESGKASEANLEKVREIIRHSVESGLVAAIGPRIDWEIAERLIPEGKAKVVLESSVG